MCRGRRDVLAGAGGVVVGMLGWPWIGAQGAQGAHPPLFVSCGADPAGGYVVAAIAPDGAVRFERPLPARGHGMAVHPSGAQCVVFARRPGAFAAVLDTATGDLRHWIDAAPGRRFYGHGVFSADGRRLFATENDYGAGRGVLGIYDATDGYRRLGEVPSHGVGPHDLRLMPDGRTLAVANGGIRTHPDQPRAKLDIPAMAPNLTYLDADSGRAVETAGLAPARHKLSIRHLDVNRQGTVAVAMQYEGDRRDRVPLVGLHRRGGELRLLHAPAPVERRLRHYTGSVAFDSSGAYLAVSSPRGHVVTLWQAATGRFLHDIEAIDASGVAPTGRDGEFLVTGGDGVVRVVDARSGTATDSTAADPRMRWDNHLGRLVRA